MAAALASTSSVASAATCFVQNSFPSNCSQRSVARPVVVLHTPRIVCSSTAERKDIAEKSLDQGTTGKAGFSQLVAAMSTASALTAAHPALALVDERLSTEGTGLGLGLSNSKLTWILVGVTTLIWVLYFIYSTGLPEGDDDSGLSL
ncbi:unnamed protein product [Sphagnum jensenii]|uniref:PSII 6.1 kDa protein n=1 Tax=Sphagnum jensenii TaxID=128206 RepID=A0ABP0WLS9_9BRYO